LKLTEPEPEDLSIPRTEAPDSKYFAVLAITLFVVPLVFLMSLDIMTLVNVTKEIFTSVYKTQPRILSDDEVLLNDQLESSQEVNDDDIPAVARKYSIAVLDLSTDPPPEYEPTHIEAQDNT